MKLLARKTKAEATPEDQGVPWVGRAQLVARLTSGVVLASLVSGPVLGGMALFMQTTRPAIAAAVPTRDFAGELTASELAQHTVVVLLQARRGDEALVAAYIPGYAANLPAVGAVVSEPAIAAATQQPSGVWSITVAATVSSGGVTLRRYFQVPIQVTNGAGTVLQPPAEVAGPALITGSSFSSAYTEQLSRESQVASTVSQFLRAMLTGQGEIGRYTSPGVRIAPVAPAPYAQVQLTELWGTQPIPTPTPPDGTTMEVMVRAAAFVDASTDGGVQFSYPLTLKMRAGRWEIGAVRPSPLLAFSDGKPVTNALPSAQAQPSQSAVAAPTPTSSSASPTSGAPAVSTPISASGTSSPRS